jgi:hypothetical protein
VSPHRLVRFYRTVPTPFVYSQPVRPDALIDRDAEAQKLVELAEGGHASRLSAPRRYGKTSLLYRVKLDAEKIGMACVYVDFSRAISVTDVAITIEQAYRHSLQGPVRRAAVALLRTLNPRVRMAPGGVGVDIEPRLEGDATRMLGDLLDLPVGLHQRSGRRTLVIFDEFQELLGAGERLDGLVRSRIQHHGEVASYLYAGSHPGLMRALFADRERSLYGQAQPVTLAPLADGDLADHVAARFEVTGRDPGAAREPVLGVAPRSSAAGDDARPPPVGADATGPTGRRGRIRPGAGRNTERGARRAAGRLERIGSLGAGGAGCPGGGRSTPSQ